MSSDKTLLKVLDLRKKEEEHALSLWIEARNTVISFENQIAQLKEFEQLYVTEMQGKSANSLNMSSYMAYQQFISKLEGIKIRQEAGLVNLKDQAERARQNYLEKQKERKIIESLLEKHRRERLAREAKAEQKLTDDIVSSKQARILQARALNKDHV